MGSTIIPGAATWFAGRSPRTFGRSTKGYDDSAARSCVVSLITVDGKGKSVDGEGKLVSVERGGRQMSLVAYVMVPTGHHHGAWRHPGADLGFLEAQWWIELARIYEKRRFDMLFMPDLSAIPDRAGGYGATVSTGAQGSVQLDPLVTMAALCAHTRHLGLGITRSVSFYPPYDIARAMATLDHLSGGRA